MMVQFKFDWFSRFILVAGLGLWSSPVVALPLIANLENGSNLSLATTLKDAGIATSKNNRAPYTPPPDAGTPEPTGGTGSRGGCAVNSERPSPAALVGQPHLMLTTSERPVFWIYVPYSPEEAPSGLISLQQGDDDIYEGEFNLVSTPGVVGIRLPETAPPLAVGQDYDWFIDINCVAAGEEGVGDEATPGVLDGLVQRSHVSETLANELTLAQTGLERVAAYGKHHMWYDWITELASLRSGSGENAELADIWTTVLSDEQTVLLAPWAEAPLVGEIEATDFQRNNAK